MEKVQSIKFRDNEDERTALLLTNTPIILAEMDHYWGGNAPYNSQKYQTYEWDGHNHLGTILLELRDTLRGEGFVPNVAGTATEEALGEQVSLRDPDTQADVNRGYTLRS